MVVCALVILAAREELFELKLEDILSNLVAADELLLVTVELTEVIDAAKDALF
jgi:hypothetical protein